MSRAESNLLPNALFTSRKRAGFRYAPFDFWILTFDFRILVAACAAAMSVTPFLLFEKGSGGAAFCIFATFSTLFAYNFERKRSPRAAFALLAAAVAGGILIQKSWPVWPSAAFSTAVAAAYFLPKNRRSLRSMTFLKPFSVATVWAVLSIKMPLEVMGQPFVFALFAERFCFVAALAVGWDLADFELDGRQKLETLAVRFGFFRAKMIAHGLLAAAFCSSFLLFSQGVYSFKILLAVAASLAATAFVFEKIVGKTAVETAKIALDAMMILQAAAVGLAIFSAF